MVEQGETEKKRKDSKKSKPHHQLAIAWQLVGRSRGRAGRDREEEEGPRLVPKDKSKPQASKKIKQRKDGARREEKRTPTRARAGDCDWREQRERERRTQKIEHSSLANGKWKRRKTANDRAQQAVFGFLRFFGFVGT